MHNFVPRLISWLLFALGAFYIFLDAYLLDKPWSHDFSFVTYFSGVPIAFFNSFMIVTAVSPEGHSFAFSFAILLGTLIFAFWSDYLLKSLSQNQSRIMLCLLVLLCAVNFGVSYIKGLLSFPYLMSDGQAFSKDQPTQFALLALSLMQILITFGHYTYWTYQARQLAGAQTAQKTR